MAAAASDDQPVAASDDRADVAAAVAGDAAAYARLVRRHQSAIARRMARFDRSAVEELTQEVFVQAYLSLDRYRGDAPLDHWLQRLATRVGYRHWQARAKRAHRPLSAAADVAAPPAPVAVDHGALALLDQLPPRDRLVLTLLYVDGRSVAEAADLAGWSQTMVKVQAFRARAKLKRLLIEHGLAPEGATP
jgi:RNA polymerase sigma-70 factor (ECF subfamily)